MSTSDAGLVCLFWENYSLRLVVPNYHNSFVETFPTSGIFEHHIVIKLCSLTSNKCKGIFLIYRGKLKGRKDNKQKRDSST